MKPSRVDIAFDFSVGEDLTACWFLEQVRPFVEASPGHRKLGVSGDEPWLTRYIGSKESERRIRIYRKDRQDEAFAEFIGPTLRVELILKGDQAARWWQLWDEDEQAGKRAASTIVAEMTGFKPVEGFQDLPELVRPEGLDQAQTLLSFMVQHSGRIVAWDEAGIDVVSEARRADQVLSGRQIGRSRESRLRRRVEAIAEAGVSQVVSLFRVLLARGEAQGASEASEAA